MPSPVSCLFNRVTSVLILVFIGLSLSGAAQDQAGTATDKASLSGTVTQKKGAVVHGAKAVIKSASGARLALSVNDQGVYSITGLYPRRAVYSKVRSIEAFEPWLSRVVHFPEEVLDKALRQITEISVVPPQQSSVAMAFSSSLACASFVA